MKWALIFWAAPLAFLCGWYSLSYNDLNFGYFMLSRQAHDLVFQIYGNALGMPAEDVPPLVAKALLFDTALVFAIIPLWRMRKRILGLVRAGLEKLHNPKPAQSEDSLSSAP